MLVEPVEGRAVFLSESSRDPDDRDGLEARGVRQDLPEMGVIGSLELVLDQDEFLGRRILAKDVRAERADFLLLC